MKKITKQLLVAYLVLVVVKTLFVYFIPTPMAHADYYVYAKMARSFFMSGTFNIHEIPTSIYPPLYPIFISLSYIFSDMRIVYFFMKFINVILMTSILFPSYLLAKEFLSKKESFLVALLISLIPSNFALPAEIMAENLFYPLFMFSIFFLYKSFKEDNYRWDILTGVFVGLCYLTKVIAILFAPIIAISFIFYILFKNKVKNKTRISLQIKKKAVLIFFSILTISPWVIRNAKLFGLSLGGIIGARTSSEIIASLSGKYTLYAFITMFIFYLGFLILSSGILFFIANFSLFKRIFKNNKLFVMVIILFSSLISSLIIAANHNSAKIKHFTLYPWLTGKFIGRYIDYILPLVFIVGFIGFKYYKRDKKFIKIVAIITSLLLLFSSQLVFVSLFPINNLSLTWLGVLNYIINFISYKSTNFTPVANIYISIFFAIIFFVMPFIILFFMKFSLKRILPYFMIFFLAGSLLSIGAIYFDSSHFWYKGEQVQLGLWFNEYDKDKISNILFDERDKGIITKYNQEGIYSGSYTVIGFWMNDNIIIGDVNNTKNIDYIISKHKIDYPVLYKSKDNIYVYKVF